MRFQEDDGNEFGYATSQRLETHGLLRKPRLLRFVVLVVAAYSENLGRLAFPDQNAQSLF